MSFQIADATQTLPFSDASFDAIICVDSLNHFVDRLAVFKEWRRVLKIGGRALFVDPVVLTGPVSNVELAQRSSIGAFVFVPPELTEQWAKDAGLAIIVRKDVTQAGAAVAGRWRDARARHREALLAIESEAQFVGLQAFFDAVHRLMRDARLSRFCWLCEAV